MSSIAGIEIDVISIYSDDKGSHLIARMTNPVSIRREAVYFTLACADGHTSRNLIITSEAGLVQAKTTAAETGPVQIVMGQGFPGFETVEVTVRLDERLTSLTNCRAELRGVW